MKLKSPIIMLITIFLALILPPSSTRAAHFERVGFLRSPNLVSYGFMTTQGNHMAIDGGLDRGLGMEIIDISDPTQLTVLGYSRVGQLTGAGDLDLNGDFAYIPGVLDGLFIYDLSDLQNIRLASRMPLGTSPIAAVRVRQGIALVGSDNNGYNGGLYSVNVEDPYHPSNVWHSDTMGCNEIILGQSRAYGFSWCNQVRIFDITYMQCPRQIVHFTCPEINGIDVDEQRALLYLTTFDYGIQIYDISNPSAPELLSTTMLPSPAIPLDVCHSKIYNQLIFASGYIRGLWALDVSDPSHPETTAVYFPPEGWCARVYSIDDIIYYDVNYTLGALRYYYDDEDIDPGEILPTSPSLSQNYPNPFNQTTVISYSLPESRDVRLEIYDIMGREISTMIYGRQPAGDNYITWDASNRPSGTYFYKLISGDLVLSKKMILLK